VWCRSGGGGGWRGFFPGALGVWRPSRRPSGRHRLCAAPPFCRLVRASRATRGIAFAVSMLRRRRCGPCRSPYPGMLDIYTAVQIRGQSAVHPATSALVNDGRTANVGRAPRLALAIACALGNFAETRLSGGRRIAWPVFRLRPHRLGTAAAASAVSRSRWLFGGVGDLLERRTTLRRSPPGQYIALQPRAVPAGRLQRALSDGELDALTLQAR